MTFQNKPLDTVINVLNKWDDIKNFLDETMKWSEIFNPYYAIARKVDDQGKVHFKEMMKLLWNNEYREIIVQRVEGKCIYQQYSPQHEDSSDLYIERLLAEIYYDLQGDSLQDNYNYSLGGDPQNWKYKYIEFVIKYLKPTIKLNNEELSNTFKADYEDFDSVHYDEDDMNQNENNA